LSRRAFEEECAVLSRDGDRMDASRVAWRLRAAATVSRSDGAPETGYTFVTIPEMIDASGFGGAS
jgi:hypothetical protein